MFVLQGASSFGSFFVLRFRIIHQYKYNKCYRFIGLQELKQGYLAQQHALVVGKNVRMLIEGRKKESEMAKHKAGAALAIVSLGRREAVSQIMCVSMVGHIPGMLKSGDLFVGKTRKQLGLKSNID